MAANLFVPPGIRRYDFLKAHTRNKLSAIREADLKQAFAGLIGLSNSLSLNATPALQINLIQRGLKLPRDYTDTDIAKIEATIRARGTDEVRKTPSDNI